MYGEIKIVNKVSVKQNENSPYRKTSTTMARKLKSVGK